MRLTARLIVIVMLAVTLVTAVYGYLSVQRADRRLKELLRDQAQTLGQTLEREVVIQWRQSGHAGVMALAQRTSVNEGRVGVRWVRPDVPRGHDQAPRAEHLPEYMEGREFLSIVERDRQGVTYLRTYYPIHVDREQPGYLEFSESLEQVEHFKREIWYELLALLGAFLACGGIVTLVGVRLVGRPLQRLIEKTERIGRGDFSGPLRLRGYAELSRLADSLNRMCEQLEESQRQIQSETAARLAAVEQLRHADRLKTVGRLASGVAHELGTPLNVAAGRAELIASGRLGQEDVARSAQAIKKEVDRMAAIIRQLLDFARRGKPRRGEADLRAIVRQSLDLLEPLARRRDVQLCFQEVAEPMRAHVDPGQIQQVVTNLVDNAIQAQPRGGKVEVRLEETRRRRPDAPPVADTGAEAVAETRAESGRQARPDDAEREVELPFYAISVTDQGAGIEPADLEHIFEPFFTTKDVGEGTGLGLSVSYGIVEDHAGWIDVTSTLGQGSRFTVYLPREA